MSEQENYIIDKGTSERPDISICIANYNGADVLLAAVNSIFRQITNCSYEIIVHDDASSDNAMTQLIEKFPQIETIFSEKNVGFCVANNRMVNKSRGKYVLLLNNDAELFPDALETLFRNAESMVGSPILGLPQFNAVTKELIDVGSWYDYGLNAIPITDIKTQKVGLIIGACLWLERQVWDEVGGFPDCFESLAEDTYLCLAARILKHPIIALGESGFYHRVGHSLGGGKFANGLFITNKKRRAMTERNKLLVILACYPMLILIILFPLHCILILLEGAILSLIKRDRSYFVDVYVFALIGAIKNIKFSISARNRFKQKSNSYWQVFSAMKLFPRKLKVLMKYGFPTLR